MSSIIVGKEALEAPPGLTVKNFLVDGLYHFCNQRRTASVTEVILHETVTAGWRATIDVLKQRNLGVHFIVDPTGVVYQHGDLQDDLLWHASQHNGTSVGIETVNPYEPKYMPKNGFWHQVMKAPWAVAGEYVVPPPVQLEAVYLLVNWLTSTSSKLQIPQLWPGLSEKKLSMGLVPSDVALHPGIHAHKYFAHMDGAFEVLYCWLRMEVALPPDAAFDRAVVLATGASASVDLSAYFAENPYLTS